MRDEASLDDRLAGSVPFCTMFAVAVAGWQLLRQRRAIGDKDSAQATPKTATVRFFLDRIVPEASGLRAAATAGAEPLYALTAEQFVG